MYLPTRAVIRESYRKLALSFGDQACEIDDAKIRAALAWPRMMVTSKSSGDLFEVVLSLFTGILSEQPATKGNATLAIFLVMMTLRRNGMMLDVTNDEVMKLFANIAKGGMNEKALITFLQQKSIPL
jgi:prophage maintenance system killer protein